MSDSRDTRGSHAIYYQNRMGTTFISGSPPDETTVPPPKGMAHPPTLLRGVSHLFVDRKDEGPILVYEKGDEIDSGNNGTAFLFSEKKNKKMAVVKTQRLVKKSRYDAVLPLARHEAHINTVAYGEGILIEVPRPEYVFKLAQDDLLPQKNEVFIEAVGESLECSVAGNKSIRLSKAFLAQSHLSRAKDIEQIFAIVNNPEADLLKELAPFYTQILDELSFHQLVPGFTLHTLMKLIPGVRLDRYKIMNPIHLLETFLKILDAIEFLHKKYIIHLDIKMVNILIDVDAHLVDFGLSTLTKGFGSRSLTWDLHWKKTITHLAPELKSQVPPDPRQDIYSAGNLLERLVKKSKFLNKEWHGLQTEVDELAIKMKDDKPEKRPTLPEVRHECKNILQRLKEAEHRQQQKDAHQRAQDNKLFVQITQVVLRHLQDPKKFFPNRKGILFWNWLAAPHADALKSTIDLILQIEKRADANWVQLLKILNSFRVALNSDKDDYLNQFAELFNKKNMDSVITHDELIALAKDPFQPKFQ